MPYRVERLAEAIKKELSDLLHQEIKDPRIGFTTITDVEVSADLRHAKIYVSVYGSEEEQRSTMEALRRAQGFIRTELGRRIQLRHVPEISFKLDDSIRRGARVIELLEEVRGSGERQDE